MQDSTTDWIVYNYLEKQRYHQASRSFKEEAPALQNGMTLGPTFDSSKGLINQLLFHLVGENDVRKYITGFDQLVSWVDNSLDMYKGELRQLLYPIFIHCYLELINLNASGEGLEFIARHQKRFLDHGSPGVDLRHQELDDLRNVVARDQLSSNPVSRNARNKKFPVQLSLYSQQILFNFLSSAGLVLILGIINQHIKLQVIDRQPQAQPPGEEGREGSLITGQLHDEALTLNRRPINLHQLEGRGEASIKPAEPPPAPEVEEGGDDEDVARARKKQKIGPQKPADKDRAKPRPELKLREAEIPLLPQSEEWAAELLQDSQRRVRVGRDAPPTILLLTFLNTANTLNAVDISRDASLLAGGFSDSSVRIYDLEALSAARALPPEEQDGAGMHLLCGHSDAVYSVSFSQDRQYVLSGSSDGTVRFWSLELLANLTAYRGHVFPVWDVATCPFGYYFVSGSADRTARLWCTERSSPLRIFAGHNSDVDVVRWHPNAHFVGTGSSDRTLRLWDVRTGEAQRVFMGHESPVTSMAFSPDGNLLASGDAKGCLSIWDLAEGKRVGSMPAHRAPLWSLSFSSGEGNMLASGGGDNAICLWDIQGLPSRSAGAKGHAAELKKKHAQAAFKFRTKSTPVCAVHFTPQNLLLGSGSLSVSQQPSSGAKHSRGAR